MKTKKILFIITMILLLCLGVCYIVVNAIFNKVTYTNFSQQEYMSEIELEQQVKKDNPNNLKIVSENEINFEKAKIIATMPAITNILLVGEENVFNDERGRTDSIMILTINKNDKTLKLTSLMRDTYVQIPGYKDNRINAAFALGGIDLLKETIKTNYGIIIDNTVLVDFKTFSNIIDILGGVNIELSDLEVEYLIKNYPDFENKLVVGNNLLDGEKALAYSRIRYCEGITGEINDFGRTNRQRTVLSKVYEQYKDISILELIKVLNEILPCIKTDLTREEIVNYLYLVLSLDVSTLETYRIPIDDSYQGVFIREMAVLQLDWDLNRKAIQEFIYGKELEKEEINE